MPSFNSTPPCLDKALSNVSIDGKRGRGSNNKQSKGSRGKRVHGMALGDFSISSSLETYPKVLKILVMGGNHTVKLIIPLWSKVIKRSILNLNICLWGPLLILNGPKGDLNLFIIMGRGLGERTRVTLVCKLGKGRYRIDNLTIIKQP